MLLVTFALGVLGSSLLEYAHHRLGGHRVRTGGLYRSHQSHHRDPDEGGVTLLSKYVQRLPVVLVALALFGVPPVLFLGAAGLGATVGLLAGYLWSEALHHAMHHRAPRNSLEGWLWRHHYAHHWGNTSANYGFTSPLWDVVFGTWVRVEAVRVPTDQLPAGAEAWPGIHRRERPVPARSSP